MSNAVAGGSLACTRCGADNPGTASFCMTCGAALPEQWPGTSETRKTITVICCAVDNFGELGARLDPEALQGLLADYRESMRTVVDRYGATMEQWASDTILVVFGVPRVHGDDALRSVLAASEMRSVLNHRNDEFQRVWGVRITTRTGIGTGTVVAATDSTPSQLALAGDAINLATRLERIARPGEVLLSDATYRLVRGAVAAEPVTPVPADGRQAPVRAVRLLGVIYATNRAPHLDAPMVGRDQEQSLLLQSFERAVSNRACQLFTILGEAGVGKSRLVHELTSLVQDRAAVIQGQCLPYGDGITFWPLVTAVRQGANLREDDTPSIAHDKLTALLGDEQHGPSIADHVLQVLGIAEPAAPPEQILWAVRKLLEALAGERPLVVVFDDIQWGEAKFLDMVEHVAEWSRDVWLLIVCVARPELLDTRPTWGGGKLNSSTILLEPLSDEESKRLLAHLLDYQDLAVEAWDRISEAAEGNPLFIEEVLGMLVDDGALVRSDGRWVLAADTSRVTVPPTIEALLAERLERLPREVRAVIECAAVVGRIFYRDAVVELASPRVGSAVDDHLMTLVGKGFIQPIRAELTDEETFRFRHLLIRDAAYESLPKALRWRLHERLARWVDAKLGDRVGEAEELVGYHLEQAHRYRSELSRLDARGRVLAAEAAERLARAGRRAFGLGDVTAATNLLGRAAALLSTDDLARLEILGLLGRALRIAGDFPKANLVLAELLEGATATAEDGLRVHALVERAFIRLYTDPEGRPEEAIARAGEAIQVFERLGDDRSLAEVWNLLAVVHLMRSDMSQRQEALERALVHARRSGDTRTEAWTIWGIVGSMAQGPTSAAEAAAFAERQLELARTKGWRLLEAGASLHLGRLHAMLGRFDQAHAQVADARRFCEELGLPFWAAATWHFSGLVEWLAGNPSEAEKHIRRGYEALGQLGEQTYRATAAAYLARVLCDLGRFDEAMNLTREVEEVAATDDVHTQMLWRGARAKALARRGDDSQALHLAEEAVVLSQSIHDPSERADILMDLAEVRRLGGLPVDASEAARQALELYEAKGNLIRARAVRTLFDHWQSLPELQISPTASGQSEPEGSFS